MSLDSFVLGSSVCFMNFINEMLRFVVQKKRKKEKVVEVATIQFKSNRAWIRLTDWDI